MSELTPEERRAVEAAKVWRARNEVAPGWTYAAGHSYIARAFAQGHLSGFRAGVAAALEIVNRDYDRDMLGDYTIDSIRALAQAQENEHGS